MVTAGIAGVAGNAAGSSSGNKKAASALLQRDRDVAAADHQLLTGVGQAQKERDAANQRAQQVLADEQPAKDAAAKAKSDYTTKLNSLNSLAAQLSQRESAVTQRENAVKQRENAVAAAEHGLQAVAFGNGTFLVGRDIQPGTYSSPGPDGSNPVGCYYARLSSTNTTDIIDNNISQGQNLVTVSPTDVALEVEGCQGFKRIG